VANVGLVTDQGLVNPSSIGLVRDPGPLLIEVSRTDKLVAYGGEGHLLGVTPPLTQGGEGLCPSDVWGRGGTAAYGTYLHNVWERGRERGVRGRVNAFAWARGEGLGDLEGGRVMGGLGGTRWDNTKVVDCREWPGNEFVEGVGRSSATSMGPHGSKIS